MSRKYSKNNNTNSQSSDSDSESSSSSSSSSDSDLESTDYENIAMMRANKKVGAAEGNYNKPSVANSDDDFQPDDDDLSDLITSETKSLKGNLDRAQQEKELEDDLNEDTRNAVRLRQMTQEERNRLQKQAVQSARKSKAFLQDALQPSAVGVPSSNLWRDELNDQIDLVTEKNQKVLKLAQLQRRADDDIKRKQKELDNNVAEKLKALQAINKGQRSLNKHISQYSKDKTNDGVSDMDPNADNYESNNGKAPDNAFDSNTEDSDSDSGDQKSTNSPAASNNNNPATKVGSGKDRKSKSKLSKRHKSKVAGMTLRNKK